MSVVSADAASAIEVTHLRKVYGSGHTEVVAVRDASLSIARGEIVGMLGPSGSGKSTILTAMALINPPTSGQISIAGTVVLDGPRALVDLRAFRRKHLGFVFQKANLIPFLNALENVQIALELNDRPPREARVRAMELLDYLGVAARATCRLRYRAANNSEWRWRGPWPTNQVWYLRMNQRCLTASSANK